MAFSIRTLLLATLAIGLWIATAPKFLAALAFVLACIPCVVAIVRFRRIRKRLGATTSLVILTLSLALFYVALAGPWLMYTTYHGCAASYGIETPVCDFADPFMMTVMVPVITPATEFLESLVINEEYDPSERTSISNFDSTAWYECEWVRYGLLLLTDEPPF